MIPNGWNATQIGSIAKLTSGNTPSKQNNEYWNGINTWVSGKDLKTHYLKNSIDKLTDSGYEVAKKAPKGATLILVRGMTLLKDFPVGYAAKEVAFNQDIKSLEPMENIDGLYLSFLLVSVKHKIRQLISIAGHGTGRLDTNLLKQFPINLPSFPEQKKIAQILSTWDKAITITEQVLSNSQQQKKALMQQLLTGKKRLLDKNGTRFNGEWEKIKLSKVAEMNSGGTPKSTVKEYYDGDIPWVSIADMTKNGKWISSTDKNISELGLANSSARMYPKNTVLYAMYASIGECSIAKVPLSSSQAILGIRTNEQLDYKFLYFFLTSLKSKIKLQGQQGTQANLNAGMVKNFSIGLPCIQEQQKIVEVLTSTDQGIKVLKEKIAHFKQEKKALMQQLLTGERRVKLGKNKYEA